MNRSSHVAHRSVGAGPRAGAPETFYVRGVAKRYGLCSDGVAVASLALKALVARSLGAGFETALLLTSLSIVIAVARVRILSEVDAPSVPKSADALSSRVYHGRCLTRFPGRTVAASSD